MGCDELIYLKLSMPKKNKKTYRWWVAVGRRKGRKQKIKQKKESSNLDSDSDRVSSLQRRKLKKTNELQFLVPSSLPPMSYVLLSI
jgi:hypothetical protein